MRFLLAAAVALLLPAVSTAQAPISPLAPPGADARACSAPALPPDFALLAGADDACEPVGDVSDALDVPRLEQPALDVTEVLPSPLPPISEPRPAEFGLARIPLSPPEAPPRAGDGRFDARYWLLFGTWGLLQIADAVTTWDAMARCPGCREANPLLRRPGTEHPHYGAVTLLKSAVGGASLYAESRSAGKVADGLLWGGVAGAIVAIPLAVTVGK